MKKFRKRGILRGLTALILVFALVLEPGFPKVAAEELQPSITDVSVAGDQVTVSCGGYADCESSWIAIYTKEVWEAGLSDTAPLYPSRGYTVYSYCKDMQEGKKSFTLVPGSYYAILYLNDDYQSVLQGTAFEMEAEKQLSITDVSVAGNQVTISCAGYEVYGDSWITIYTKTAWESEPKGAYGTGTWSYAYCKDMPGGKETVSVEPGSYYAVLFQAGGMDTVVSAKAFTVENIAVESSAGTVYVDAVNGSDSNTGDLPQQAVKTVEKAVALVNTAEVGEKTVVLKSGADLAGTLPYHTDMITIKGDGSANAGLTFTNHVTINGPLTLEHMKLQMKENDTFLNTAQSRLVLGEGLEIEVYPAFHVHMGTPGTNGGHEETVIDSGRYGNIFLGAFFNQGSRRSTAGVDLVVNGGAVSKLLVCGDGIMLSGFEGNDFTENVNITFNGGSFGQIYTRLEGVAEEKFSGFQKAFQIILNNNITGILPKDNEVSAAGGYWVMKGETGGTLAATSMAGVFTVGGGKTAVAASEDGSRVYVSSQGTLHVPVAGTYHVTYSDQVDYINSGTRIEFLADCEVNLSEMSHKDLPGKLFVGWVDPEGRGVDGQAFSKGTVLSASYVDYDTVKDFQISGAQMKKIDGTEKGTLRFRSRISDHLLETLEVERYGTLLLPVRYLGTQDLTLDGVYGSGNETRQALDQPVETPLGRKDGYTMYGAVVKELGSDDYREQYMVRGYLCYQDLNGYSRVLYTDYHTASMYSVTTKVLELSGLSSEERQCLDQVRDYAEITLKEQYFKQGKTTVQGTQEDLTGWIYRLDNGLSVREAEFDSGKGGEPVEIVQVSDFHFNFCNEKDFAENNPSTMSTYYNRGMNPDGSSVGTVAKCMEYGSFFDQVVVTGDAIDYLSWGALELLQKYVWDPCPGTLVTLGNHEPVRVMGLPTDVPDPSSLESRYQILQDCWAHDVYYTSKVLADKVMVIQLDNSQNKFWDCQVEPLERDLAKAREQGLMVLVFMHCAISTGNPADTDCVAIRVHDPEGGRGDFYHTIGNKSDDGEATRQVYRLLTENGDVVKGFFTGHMHSDFYMEVQGQTPGGAPVAIPQYILTDSDRESGTLLKITVR